MAEQLKTETTPPTELPVAPPSIPSSKMVPESDLLVVKSMKEGLEKKLQESESTYKSQISDMTTKSISLEAKIKELEGQMQSATLNTAELTKAKEQVAALQKKADDAEKKLLDTRRTHLSQIYGVPLETLINKSPEQLDIFEEALKIAGKRPAGNYAIGGAYGGGAVVELPLDRARRVLAEHAERKGSVAPSGMRKE